MATPSEPLRQAVLKALRQEQKASKRTGKEMARHLEVTPSTWGMMKVGLRSISFDTMVTAAARSAAARAVVLSFFARLGDEDSPHG